MFYILIVCGISLWLILTTISHIVIAIVCACDILLLVILFLVTGSLRNSRLKERKATLAKECAKFNREILGHDQPVRMKYSEYQSYIMLRDFSNYGANANKEELDYRFTRKIDNDMLKNLGDDYDCAICLMP